MTDPTTNPDPDDAEGHSRMRSTEDPGTPDANDTEGHVKASRAVDDDDVEGHGRARN